MLCWRFKVRLRLTFSALEAQEARQGFKRSFPGYKFFQGYPLEVV